MTKVVYAEEKCQKTVVFLCEICYNKNVCLEVCLNSNVRGRLRMGDFQKAGMWKRISAALLDLVLLVTVVIGVALLLSTALNYAQYVERMDALYDEYEAEYGLSFDISAEEYQAMSPEEKIPYDEAYDAFANDEEALLVQGKLFTYALMIVSFSILAGYLLLEFIVPLLFGNGQTLGKKIFGIGVMRIDSVKISPLLLFARTILGKCTVETLVPALLLVMIIFGLMGAIAVFIIIGLAVLQIVLVAATKGRTPIHDVLAQTVTVDFASQRIFDSPEALLEYKKKIHAEAVEKDGN